MNAFFTIQIPILKIYSNLNLSNLEHKMALLTILVINQFLFCNTLFHELIRETTNAYFC